MVGEVLKWLVSNMMGPVPNFVDRVNYTLLQGMGTVD
jgi:hypothetical protein